MCLSLLCTYVMYVCMLYVFVMRVWYDTLRYVMYVCMLLYATLCLYLCFAGMICM